MDDFENWLCDQLRALNTDEATFSGYIKGILEEEGEDWDEKIEGIEELLQELGASKVQDLRAEIVKKWKEALNPTDKASGSDGNTHACQKTQQLDPHLSGQTDDAQFEELLKLARASESTPSVNSGGEKDMQLKNAILAHLSSESEGEDEDDKLKPSTSAAGLTEKRKAGSSSLPPPLDVGRNANVEKVLSEQKELRDKAKAEHEKKKERDKEDRAKQKSAAQDRKDKAKKKSAKVERKR